MPPRRAPARRPPPPRARPRPHLPAPPGGVQLAWARDRDGLKVRAARLTAADRRARAPFTCLGCGEELVPHLGRVRSPHFAHRAGSRCPLTSPETALHLDAKERLLALCAEAFAGRRRLTALARCPSCRRRVPLDVGALGDRAEPEGTVGPLRADVLIRAGVRPALALEVRVTHAVEPEKEAALAAAGLPALEIDAREEWEREVPGGAELACARTFGLPPCPACRLLERADRDRGLGGEAAEIAELEGYRARGLLGRLGPGPSARASTGPARAEGAAAAGQIDAPLGAAERRDLAARFCCPQCGSKALEFGERIARHPCPGRADQPGEPAQVRPVAWRGYDGSLATLTWWVS